MNCRKCDKVDFEFYSSNKFVCKECVKAQSAMWRQNNLQRRRTVQNKYDWVKRKINDPEKARGIKESVKSCAICNSGNNLQVDHCHETGTVRSMLCGPCNRSLGGFADNPDLLRKAAEYVEKYNTASI